MRNSVGTALLLTIAWCSLGAGARGADVEAPNQFGKGEWAELGERFSSASVTEERVLKLTATTDGEGRVRLAKKGPVKLAWRYARKELGLKEETGLILVQGAESGALWHARGESKVTLLSGWGPKVKLPSPRTFFFSFSLNSSFVAGNVNFAMALYAGSYLLADRLDIAMNVDMRLENNSMTTNPGLSSRLHFPFAKRWDVSLGGFVRFMVLEAIPIDADFETVTELTGGGIGGLSYFLSPRMSVNSFVSVAESSSSLSFGLTTLF